MLNVNPLWSIWCLEMFCSLTYDAGMHDIIFSWLYLMFVGHVLTAV